MPFKDPQRQRAYGREWMKRNPEKAREAMRRWRKNHPEEHNADQRAYYRRDPKKAQRIIDASPNRAAVRRAAENRRRAREVAGGSFTAAEWAALITQYGGRCAYRGELATLHVDHRTPLSRGGSNRIENILPACARCNLEKARMTEAEFRARLAAERDDHLESA
ncbi:MAG TPA: HNH endonuclease signature motif containing protein [Candidatus Limnocylindria bacterium]|nr:HNH endonuclease signature motif containing protein [Candidatus Limnocylindria bacterium]